ncbi:hypothetical protein [Vibrio sp. 10N.239.312.D08]|uniref:hypothetical protein n=1 Tax=Vibrio sp. 10N.239.312.D08 TaxID=3229978 RepID=UPI003552EDD5
MPIFSTKVSVHELQKYFDIDEIIKMTEVDEYDAEKELYELDFTNVQIKKIAQAQMNLIVDDLRCHQLHGFGSDHYQSAYAFVGTNDFIELCETLGTSRDAAEYTQKWFLYRYTPEYDKALQAAAEGESYPEYICKTRFAYELANYLFENRNNLRKFVDTYIGDKSLTYWEEMSKQGLKSYACRSMLTGLFAENRNKGMTNHDEESE